LKITHAEEYPPRLKLLRIIKKPRRRGRATQSINQSHKKKSYNNIQAAHF